MVFLFFFIIREDLIDFYKINKRVAILLLNLIQVKLKIEQNYQLIEKEQIVHQIQRKSI